MAAASDHDNPLVCGNESFLAAVCTHSDDAALSQDLCDGPLLTQQSCQGLSALSALTDLLLRASAQCTLTQRDSWGIPEWWMQKKTGKLKQG